MVRIMIVDDHPLMRRVVREILSQEQDMEIVADACNGLEAETLAAQTQPDVVLMDLDLPDCDGFEATERVHACSPTSHIIIFTATHQDQHIFHALQSGAVGYITKDIEPETLVQAIRSALRNDLYIPHSIARHVVAQLRALGHMRDAYQRSISQQGQATNYQSGQETTSHLSQQHLLRTMHTPTSIAHRIIHSPKAQSVALADVPEQQASPNARPLTEREQEILNLMRRGRKNREIASELSIAESTVHKHVQNIFEKLHARNRAEAIYLTNSAK